MSLKLVKETEIPLWDISHSTRELEDAEAENYTSYLLNYEGKEEVHDPSSAAYKHFSDAYHPEGNVTESRDYNPYHRRVIGKRGASPPILTCDFNRSPHCWALMQVQDGLFVVFDEIKNDDALTSEQASDAVSLLKSYDIGYVLLAGDNTSNQGGGRTGRNDWDDVKKVLKEGGIRFSAQLLGISNPKRKERVDTANNVIFTDSDKIKYKRRLVIHRRCEWAISDYKYSIVGEDGIKKKNQGDRGHMSDAIDYPVYYIFRETPHITYIL